MKSMESQGNGQENGDFTIPDFFREEFPHLSKFLDENLIKKSYRNCQEQEKQRQYRNK